MSTYGIYTSASTNNWTTSCDASYQWFSVDLSPAPAQPKEKRKSGPEEWLRGRVDEICRLAKLDD